MRIVTRGVAIAFGTLILTGWTLPTPVESVLYSFQGGNDGFQPLAGLIADREGAALRHNASRRECLPANTGRLWHGFQADARPGPDHGQDHLER